MLPEYVKYYHSVLSDVERDVYRQIYEGFRARKKRFHVKCDRRHVTAEDLGRISGYVLYDTPSFYYVDLDQYQWWTRRGGYDYSRKYLYDDETINHYDEVIGRGIERFRTKMIRPDMSEYEREVAIHDYLVGHVTYDYEACASLERTGHTSSRPEAFNVIGVLRDQKAVCEGISKTFKLLCDACRVKCFVVIGRGMEQAPDKPGHSWNMVKLDDRPYHVDATWDLRKKGDIRFCYDNLNLPDKLIRMDHDWSSDLYPRCDALEFNYYRRNGLYVRSLGEIPEFVAESVRAGQLRIAFKFVGQMPAREDILPQLNVGLTAARGFTEYRYLIVPETHNIYVELPTDKRDGNLESI